MEIKRNVQLGILYEIVSYHIILCYIINNINVIIFIILSFLQLGDFARELKEKLRLRGNVTRLVWDWRCFWAIQMEVLADS